MILQFIIFYLMQANTTAKHDKAHTIEKEHDAKHVLINDTSLKIQETQKAIII